MGYSLIVLWLSIVVPIVVMENDGSFSRPHVGVHFNPFTLLDDKGDQYVYDINGFLPMISKISMEFSKLMTVVGDQTEPTKSLVPSAVATFNKEHRNLDDDKLEVLLTFGMSVTRKSANGTQAEVAKQIAGDANEIFPGTVKTLYFEYTALKDSNVEEAKNYLEFVQSLLENTSYNLGGVFPFNDCKVKKEQSTSYLAKVLPYFQHVYFEVLPEEYKFIPAEKAIVQIIRKFKHCKQRLASNKEQVSVGLLTAWVQNAASESNQRDHNLVQYWEKINNWAVKYNTSVVLKSAFDPPYPETGCRFCGWWRLVENSYNDYSYDENSLPYSFEEKREAVQRQQLKTQKEPPSDNTSSTTIWLNVVGLFLLAFVVALGFFVYFRQRTKPSVLRNSELKAFYRGVSLINEADGFNQDIHRTAFNKELELAKSDFKIDPETLLGSGAFGVVCQGYVQKVKGEHGIQVAVKTTNLSSPSSALAGIVSEIKVMNYLGKHDNIVNIIGAYTKGIKKGKIYLFLELCSLGSLEKYLRKNISGLEPQHGTHTDRKTAVANYYKRFDNKMENSPVEPVKTATFRSSEPLGIKSEIESSKVDNSGSADLYRWSYEIASGMDFLASKNVVHADLAARNVLLTVDKQAKISDFGLSRRLYEYSMYVKTQQEPLPWRWMAPESLCRMEFNEKTDVWAFGVTLWEIFSLGNVPFEGLSWTPNFSSQLVEGLQLPQPRYCDSEMYTLMMKCWNGDPAGRPLFSDLKSTLVQKSSNFL